MPPLVPPALELMMLRVTWRDIAGIGGLLLILRELVQIDLIAQRREIVEIREQAALGGLDARIHRLRRRRRFCTGTFSTGFSFGLAAAVAAAAAAAP